MRRPFVLLLLAATALPPAAGCRSPRIRERPLASISRFGKEWGTGSGHLQPVPVPNSGGIDSTSPLLVTSTTAHNIHDDDQDFEARRARVESSPAPSAAAILDLAERAAAIGHRRQKKSPVLALTWHRDAATYAAFALPLAVTTDDRDRAIDLHNAAVERLLRNVGSGPNRPNPSWREQLYAVGVTLTTTAPERANLPLDELWIARDFRVRNLDMVARDGLGVPLVTLSRFPNRQRLPDHFYPDKLRLAATAVLTPGGPLSAGAWRAAPTRLILHDPAHEPATPGAPPLAADLTTPLAHQVIQSPLKDIAYGGLLTPEKFTPLTGIFMGEPYRPGAIPVLFIHGLWSSPATWLTMVNTLQADPVLRQRYQFWYAIYPTGNSILASASRLRASLHDLRNAIDPSHADPALDQMVVIGHSMGGVVTRQFLLTSGQEIERVLFQRPFDQIQLSPDSRAKLTQFLRFEREPSVRRVVMIAAPHRGSNVANQLLGRATTAMVRRPSDLKALHDEIVALNGPEVIHPRYQGRLPSGVDNLARESPVPQLLARLPMPPDVPAHSIIPTLQPEGPRMLQTDGIVSLESAHLEGVRSEINIQGTHFCTALPATTAEVHRLLHLHLNELSATPLPANPTPRVLIHTPDKGF